MTPLDTSTLGPVREVPDETVTRARMAREAIELLAGEAHAAGDYREGATWDALAIMAAEGRLAKLGRLLKWA